MYPDLILLTNVASPVWQRAIGAYQVANHCRAVGYKVQVLDFVDIFGIVELQKIIESMIGPETRAIGISTTFFHNKENKRQYLNSTRTTNQVIPRQFREMLSEIKSKYPQLKILGGGANSYKCVGDDLFDVIFHGYSESAVVEYLSQTKRIWPKVNNQIIIDGSSSHFDIEQLEHKWHDSDCILPHETLPIEISRGCIFRCKFCSYPLNGKKKFDYLRDPERIRDELLDNYNRWGTTNYYFADDTFNDSREKIRILHAMLTSLPFKIKFVTYLRFDLLIAYPEQVHLLKEMGLGSAFLGIESFNHETNKLIGKGKDPDTLKLELELLYNRWNGEIPITCSFITGLPKETEESMRETREWFVDKPYNDIWFPLTINPNGYYKSDFDINYRDYGYVLDENNSWTSPIMNQTHAIELATEFNNQGAYNDQTPSTWFLFSLLSYGFTIPELQKTKIADLHYPQLALKKVSMLSEYKRKLLQILNHSNSSSTTEAK